jgi:predicted adenylyl cyclase CyaB
MVEENKDLKIERDEGLNSGKEIERKFLVASLPDNLEQYEHQEISQGYLIVNPDGSELRIRQKGEKYFQTIKQGRGKERDESEIEITKDKFDSLWSLTDGRRIEKTRYEIPAGEQVIELDIYRGHLEGLSIVEVEFTSLESSDKFRVPSWFGSEVTDDEEYKNKNLALTGKPKEISGKSEKESSSIPVYELERGVGVLVDLIKKRALDQSDPIIVEIAGGSASGKTSKVANQIKRVFGQDAIMISIDDYYRGQKFMESAEGQGLTWDEPEALNLVLLQEHLEKLRTGYSIQKPIYDMTTSESIGTEEIKPAKVIVVEGLFALNDILKKQADIKAFVDIGPHGRIFRRLFRDIKERNKEPIDVIREFAEFVEPSHEKYILSTKKNADIIINNKYNAEIEAQNSGLHEVQLKIRGTVDSKKLRELGAEQLSASTQIDSYYNPKDRDLVKSGEILRIRNEGKRKILTYKGPMIESLYKERPKFEFEIDEDIEKKLLAIYSDKLKTITKRRTLYQLNGVIFAVDRVKKIEDGQETDLGDFIEIRSYVKKGEAGEEKGKKEASIIKLLEDLDLKERDKTKESYFDM